MAAKANSAHLAHVRAIGQALFVTFLWSTSWVLIKVGLDDIPALTFAGLRYTCAFLCLLPILLRSHGLVTLRQLAPVAWQQLILLGIVYYAVTHGAQFVSIAYLPAVTANLILGFTPAVVALLGLFWLAERPMRIQWLGMGLSIGGLIVYFYPIHLPLGQFIGLAVAVVGMLANAAAAIMGRAINRARELSPLLITTVSMGIGALLLLISGISLHGIPALSVHSWLIVLWLSIVNTAFAFTLWNHTLRTLSAVESSIVNSAMSVQIPILAVLFLGERLTSRQLIGLVLSVVGVLVVQLARVWASRGRAT
ncbi:MAG: DMT family transporter [Caldilineaceae bacterium]